MESISGVIKTMQHWNMYQGSSLSIAVGAISAKKSFCMPCLWEGWQLVWMAGAVDQQLY